MRVISGSSEGDLADDRRPLVVAGSDMSVPHKVREHHHRRRQLLYATGGHAHVKVGDRRWTLAESQGVWVPEGMRHEVSSADALSYRSVFVEPGTARHLPLHDRPVSIPVFVRELIAEARFFGSDYQTETAEHRLVSVLFDQLGTLQSSVLPVKVPGDPRLRRQCRVFLANPSGDMTQAEWASMCGISSRTLSRIFLRETGMTFSLWRERVRLLWAIDQLRAGASVTMIALDLGYNSPSAFSAMFRRVTGATPSAYLALEM